MTPRLSRFSTSWRGHLGVAALLLVALALVGSRGLWMPDEGRNVDIARAMLESGDFWRPRLVGNLYLDKPPFHFWTLAAGMAVLGQNEWGVRVPHALLYLATAFLLGALATRLWDARTGRITTWVYALMLGPFAAGSVVTPDTPLALFLVAVFYGTWRACEDGDSRKNSLWWLLVGAAVGLAFLTKGPAVLMFGPSLFVFVLVRKRLLSTLAAPALWVGVVLALALGASWYVPICRALPGAREYLFDNQVTGRLVSAQYDRNPGLVGALRIYLPALAVGPLPWSLTWFRGFRPIGWHLSRASARLRPSALLTLAPTTLFLASWIALPALVLIAASSHLPLYFLPLLAPIALASARGVATWLPPGPLPRRHRLTVGLWCLFLVALRVVAAYMPSHRDTRASAHWLAEQGVSPTETVLLIDTPLEGLSLYGFEHLVATTLRDKPYPLYTPLPTPQQAALKLAQAQRSVIAIVPRHKVSLAVRALKEGGLFCSIGQSASRTTALRCTPYPDEATATIQSLR